MLEEIIIKDWIETKENKEKFNTILSSIVDSDSFKNRIMDTFIDTLDSYVYDHNYLHDLTEQHLSEAIIKKGEAIIDSKDMAKHFEEVIADYINDIDIYDCFQEQIEKVVDAATDVIKNSLLKLFKSL